MELCSNCPNRILKTNEQIILKQRPYMSARVLFKNDEALIYFFINHNSMGYGEIPAIALKQEHPDLAEEIENCSGSRIEKRLRPGLLGKIGLSKNVMVCSAISNQIDLSTASSVRDYFQGNK